MSKLKFKKLALRLGFGAAACLAFHQKLTRFTHNLSFHSFFRFHKHKIIPPDIYAEMPLSNICNMPYNQQY